MAITLRDKEKFLIYGNTADLFADTKAEIVAEDAVLTTTNAGVITCPDGSSCITPLGEVMILNSAGVWAQI